MFVSSWAIGPRKQPQRPSVPARPDDPLDLLAARYVRGDLDLIEFLLAVDAYPAQVAGDAKSDEVDPVTRANRRSRGLCDDPSCWETVGWSQRICTGRCRRPDLEVTHS